MELSIPISSKYNLLIKMISPLIGDLTSKEVDILVTIAENDISILDKDNRTIIRMSLDMDKFNFNNYLSKLKAKKILISDKSILKVNPKIVYMLKQESFNIKFV